MIVLRTCAALTAALVTAVGCASDRHHLLHQDGEPAMTGNPAADPTLPPRFGRPGRLLLRCAAPGDRSSASWGMYASAQDFDEGRQSFYLKRTDLAGGEILYPLHGHFLDGGLSGIFMVHDGQGIKRGETVLIDQSVNMGLLFVRATDKEVGATLAVFAEERADNPTEPEESALSEYSCRWGKDIRRLSSQAGHVRAQPNSGATPPSHWFRESDKTLLDCRAIAPAHPRPAETGPFPSSTEGEYRLELLGSTIWPGHLGFLVVRAPGREPVGYNVHLLAGPRRLLIHAHSYPHRTRARTFDTMEETETVIGGLLLDKTDSGYTGWVGLASSSTDPYNISFSREATMGDYVALGRVVVPPLPVTCK